MLSFRKFLLQLEAALGNIHLPLNHNAHCIHDFLGEGAVDPEFSRCLTKTVYKANGCGHLDAEIDPLLTYSVVGRLKERFLGEKNADLNTALLFERLDQAMKKALYPVLQTTESPQANQTPIPCGDTGVISFRP